jgi:hypothetical protein
MLDMRILRVLPQGLSKGERNRYAVGHHLSRSLEFSDWSTCCRTLHITDRIAVYIEQDVDLGFNPFGLIVPSGHH